MHIDFDVSLDWGGEVRGGQRVSVRGVVQDQRAQADPLRVQVFARLVHDVANFVVVREPLRGPLSHVLDADSCAFGVRGSEEFDVDSAVAHKGVVEVHVCECLKVCIPMVPVLRQGVHFVFVDAEPDVLRVGGQGGDVHYVIVDSCDFCLCHSASNIVDVGNCLFVLRHVCGGVFERREESNLPEHRVR